MDRYIDRYIDRYVDRKIDRYIDRKMWVSDWWETELNGRIGGIKYREGLKIGGKMYNWRESEVMC